LAPACFHRNYGSFRFAVNVGDGERPERNEIDSRHELGEKRRRELPVPAEEKGEHAGDAEIEDIVSGRGGALDEERKDGDLEYVREDREREGCFDARAGGDGDGVLVRVRGLERKLHKESMDQNGRVRRRASPRAVPELLYTGQPRDRLNQRTRVGVCCAHVGKLGGPGYACIGIALVW